MAMDHLQNKKSLSRGTVEKKLTADGVLCPKEDEDVRWRGKSEGI